MAEKEIKVLFPEEKMEALNYFMKQKEVEVEKMLTEHLEKIYEKMVPAPVREFTESKLCVEHEETPAVESGANSRANNQRRTRGENPERAERRNARTVNQSQNDEPQAEPAEEAQDEIQEETSGIVMGM